jgi:hypothetical protein
LRRARRSRKTFLPLLISLALAVVLEKKHEEEEEEKEEKFIMAACIHNS